MYKRGVALFVCCAVSSVAFAGATIELIPTPSGPYRAGDTILVDVMLSQDTGSDVALRMIQFDVSDTEINETDTEGLFILFPDTQCGGILFWEFGSTVVGQGNSSNCGANHYIDPLHDNNLPCCTDILAIAYGSDTALGENLDEQLILPANEDSIRVGTLKVRIMPDTPDATYTLDMINADNDNQANPDLGAQVRWGFGTNIDGNPLTNWRPGVNLTGGTLDVVVRQCAIASSSTPGCNGVLPRTANNLIRIQYTSDPTAQISSVLIRELLPNGLFGTDVTASFDKVNEGGNVLKLTEMGSAVLNNTWYGISDGCNEFQFITIFGDADDNGTTNVFDVNAIWSNRGLAADNSPFDIDGNGQINAFDVNTAWSNRAPTVPGKPTGHDTCP